MFTKEIYVTSYDGELDKHEVMELFKLSEYYISHHSYKIEFVERNRFDEWIIYRIVKI